MLVGAVLRVGRTVRRRCHPWETYTPSVCPLPIHFFFLSSPFWSLYMTSRWFSQIEKGGKKWKTLMGVEKKKERKERVFWGCIFALQQRHGNHIFFCRLLLYRPCVLLLLLCSTSERGSLPIYFSGLYNWRFWGTVGTCVCMCRRFIWRLGEARAQRTRQSGRGIFPFSPSRALFFL